MSEDDEKTNLDRLDLRRLLGDIIFKPGLGERHLGGEGGEEIPPVQGFTWSLIWMRENNRTDNSFSRPTYVQDFTNIRVFSSLWASSNFTVFTKRTGKKMAFLESQRNKESL